MYMHTNKFARDFVRIQYNQCVHYERSNIFVHILFEYRALIKKSKNNEKKAL